VGSTCTVVSGVAGNVAGSVAVAGVNAVFSEAARWVSSGAVWLIAQVGRAMSASTSIDLGAGWFSAHEAVMASLAAAVVVPMACCAAILAVYRQSASMLLRTFLVHLPLSLLLTGVAVTLVRMALAVTDAMSATVLSSAGADTTNLFSGLFASLTPVGLTTAGIVPGFVVLIGALLAAAAALALWLELVVRAAAVSVAVLFLPLALAALVWPSVAHWCRRLADTLVAVVLSKLVVAAVLSLAASAIAGGAGVSGSESGGGFASVVAGIALLVIAVLSPFTLLRLVPAVEAGAVSHLESARHRLKSAATTPARTGGNLALEQLRRTKDQVSQGGSAVSVGTVGGSGADGTADPGGGDGGDPVGAPAGAGAGAGDTTGTAMIAGDPAIAAVFTGLQVAAATGGRGSAGGGAGRAGRGDAGGDARRPGPHDTAGDARGAGDSARPDAADSASRTAESPGVAGPRHLGAGRADGGAAAPGVARDRPEAGEGTGRAGG